jgi:mono/diheme cytochrome c family protein
MRSRLVPILALALLSAGCYGEMNNQPRYRWLAPSTFFQDGAASRVPPGGTVSRDSVDPAQPPLTAQLVARGRERFNINCMPCHGPAAEGNGSIVQHGFPAPHSFHEERLRNAPDAHFYGAMTNGYGRMYPYADRLNPADRWAVIAYIRALQLAYDVPLSALPPDLAARARKEAK